jgi:ribosomal protein S6
MYGYPRKKIMSKTDEIVEDLGEKTIYEVGFHLISSMSEEEAGKEFNRIKACIEKEGGSFIAEDSPKSKPLAYALSRVVGGVKQKFTTSFFGWIKFEIEAPAIITIKKMFDLDEKVIRFLLIKTVRENTLAALRPVTHRPEEAKREKKVETGAKVEVNEVELDKQIDALVKE